MEDFDPTPPGKGRFIGLAVLLALLGAAVVVRATSGDDDPRAGMTPSPAPSEGTAFFIPGSGAATDQSGSQYTFATSVRSVWNTGVALAGVEPLDASGAVTRGAIGAVAAGGDYATVMRDRPPQPSGTTLVAPGGEATVLLLGLPNCADPEPPVAAIRLVVELDGRKYRQVLTVDAPRLSDLAAGACRER